MQGRDIRSQCRPCRARFIIQTIRGLPKGRGYLSQGANGRITFAALEGVQVGAVLIGHLREILPIFIGYVSDNVTL